jgi:hypothetical protein
MDALKKQITKHKQKKRGIWYFYFQNYKDLFW